MAGLRAKALRAIVGSVLELPLELFVLHTIFHGFGSSGKRENSIMILVQFLDFLF